MKQKRIHKIKLEIGKFYRVIDGSPGGHPGQIYKINETEKTFLSLVTGSMTFEEFKKTGTRKGYIKLSVPTDKKVDISLIKKRPFLGTRNDYGEKDYPDMSFDEKDLLIILKVKNAKPILGSYYKKRMRIKKSPARGTQNNCESASDK